MRSRREDGHDEPARSDSERRARDDHSDGVEPVVLTRKLADAIDGIDLAGKQVGDRLPLGPREAETLIAEGWAEPAPLEQRRRTTR
jgi:hypothetical protein